MNRMRSLALVLLLLIGAWFMAGCGDLPAESGKTLSSLTITPSVASLEVGGTKTFFCRAVYSDSTTAAVTPVCTLAGTIGAITVVSSAVIFTASIEGQGTITATYSGKSATATITVTPETGGGVGLTTVEVAPSILTARVGTKQLFTASGLNASGETIAIAPVWLISGDAIGTFTASGATATLDATTQGSAIISCTSFEITGRALVTIEGFSVLITADADTFVDSVATQDVHYLDPSVKAGYLALSSRYYESYFHFPLPVSLVPPGASIESATLQFYTTAAGTAALQLYSLAGAFNNATCWSNKPGLGNYLANSTFTAASYTTISNDSLRAAVQHWLDVPSSNEGVAVVQDGSTDTVVSILSKDNVLNPPQLKIEYKTP
jgi:hypothetical protein